jgi:hypothetical protein
MVSSVLVMIAPEAPARAAATAASVPAWPAPTTITSNSASFISGRGHFDRFAVSSGMPLKVPGTNSTVFIRREAFEAVNLQRVELDEAFNLTDAEFRLEGDLIAIGPLPSDDDLPVLIEQLEERGLVYFDDFFELSGNWPSWIELFVQAVRSGKR